MQKPQALDWKTLRPLLPLREKEASKSNFGHVLVIGGNAGMAGAARLTGEAALRTGAGLVSVATQPAHIAVIVSQRPELMAHGVETLLDIEPLLSKASVLAIGPGLGQDTWAKMLWERVLHCDLPTVFDADALNLLAKYPSPWFNRASSCNSILTPHPGEAARLLGCSVAEIQADRVRAVQLLQQRYGGVIVLKGAGTLIQAPDSEPRICNAGNPGMASGGMGDVLTGILAGLLAQGLSAENAAYLGVLLHAIAGDQAASELGERGLLASDLMLKVCKLVSFAD